MKWTATDIAALLGLALLVPLALAAQSLCGAPCSLDTEALLLSQQPPALTASVEATAETMPDTRR